VLSVHCATEMLRGQYTPQGYLDGKWERMELKVCSAMLRLVVTARAWLGVHYAAVAWAQCTAPVQFVNRVQCWVWLAALALGLARNSSIF
jgi:hypothetical protein